MNTATTTILTITFTAFTTRFFFFCYNVITNTFTLSTLPSSLSSHSCYSCQHQQTAYRKCRSSCHYQSQSHENISDTGRKRIACGKDASGTFWCHSLCKISFTKRIHHKKLEKTNITRIVYERNESTTQII